MPLFSVYNDTLEGPSSDLLHSAVVSSSQNPLDKQTHEHSQSDKKLSCIYSEKCGVSVKDSLIPSEKDSRECESIPGKVPVLDFEILNSELHDDVFRKGQGPDTQRKEQISRTCSHVSDSSDELRQNLDQTKEIRKCTALGISSFDPNRENWDPVLSCYSNRFTNDDPQKSRKGKRKKICRNPLTDITNKFVLNKTFCSHTDSFEAISLAENNPGSKTGEIKDNNIQINIEPFDGKNLQEEEGKVRLRITNSQG